MPTARRANRRTAAPGWGPRPERQRGHRRDGWSRGQRDGGVGARRVRIVRSAKALTETAGQPGERAGRGDGDHGHGRGRQHADDAPAPAPARGTAVHVLPGGPGTPPLGPGGRGGVPVPAPTAFPAAVRTGLRLVHGTQPLGHHPCPRGRPLRSGGADAPLTVLAESVPHIVGQGGELRSCGLFGGLLGPWVTRFLSGDTGSRQGESKGSVRRNGSPPRSDPPHIKNMSGPGQPFTGFVDQTTGTTGHFRAPPRRLLPLTRTATGGAPDFPRSS